MKVNIMELQGTVASVAGRNGRLSQTVQWMPGASPSGDTPGAPSIRGLRSWRRPLGLDNGPQQAVTRPREGLK
jgi:hypothetical protein